MVGSVRFWSWASASRFRAAGLTMDNQFPLYVSFHSVLNIQYRPQEWLEDNYVFIGVSGFRRNLLLGKF